MAIIQESVNPIDDPSQFLERVESFEDAIRDDIINNLDTSSFMYCNTAMTLQEYIDTHNITSIQIKKLSDVFPDIRSNDSIILRKQRESEMFHSSIVSSDIMIPTLNIDRQRRRSPIINHETNGSKWLKKGFLLGQTETSSDEEVSHRFTLTFIPTINDVNAFFVMGYFKKDLNTRYNSYPIIDYVMTTSLSNMPQFCGNYPERVNTITGASTLSENEIVRLRCAKLDKTLKHELKYSTLESLPKHNILTNLLKGVYNTSDVNYMLKILNGMMDICHPSSVNVD